MDKKANNIIRIPCTLNRSFFKYWLLFLRPFHNLTDREIEIMTSFLFYRYELSKVISDETVLNQVLMGEDTRKKIREDCNIGVTNFQVIMSKLRKSKVIVDNRINPKFIPSLTEDKGNFKLLLLFDIQ